MDKSKAVTAVLMCDGSSLDEGAGFAGTLRLMQDDIEIECIEYESGLDGVSSALKAEAVAVECGIDHLQQWMEARELTRLDSVVIRSDSASVLNTYDPERNEACPNPALRAMSSMMRKELTSQFTITSPSLFKTEKVKSHVPVTKASPLELEHNQIDKRARQAAEDFVSGEGKVYHSRLDSKNFAVTVDVLLPATCLMIEAKKQMAQGRQFARDNVTLNVHGTGVGSIAHPFLKGYQEEMDKRPEGEQKRFNYTLLKRPDRLPNTAVAWVASKMKASNEGGSQLLNTSPYRAAVANTLTFLTGVPDKPSKQRGWDESYLAMNLMQTSMDHKERTAYGQVQKAINTSGDVNIRTESSPGRVLGYATLATTAKENENDNAEMRLEVRLKEMLVYAKQPDETKNIAERLVEAIELESLPLRPRDKEIILNKGDNLGNDKQVQHILSVIAERRGWMASLGEVSQMFKKSEGESVENNLIPVEALSGVVNGGRKTLALRVALGQVVEAIPEDGISPAARMEMFVNGLEKFGVTPPDDVRLVALQQSEHSAFISHAVHEWCGAGAKRFGPIDVDTGEPIDVNEHFARPQKPEEIERTSPRLT